MNSQFQPGPILLPCKLALFFASTCFLAALPAYSQQAQLDSLAAQAAQALDKAHLKSVIVLDFSGPGLKATQLGRDLADQFSVALSAVPGRKFKVLDRSHLDAFIGKQKLSPLLRSLAPEGFPADQFGAKVVISGELSSPSGDPAFALELRWFKDRSPVGEFAKLQVVFAHTPETKTALSEVIPGTDLSMYAEPGKNGVSKPDCVYCPTPPFTDAAFNQKLQGEVILGAVITPEGRASTLVVLQGMQGGLTDSALKAVAKWKFKPAVGPDGKPVAVWTTIEVDFHIY